MVKNKTLSLLCLVALSFCVSATAARLGFTKAVDTIDDLVALKVADIHETVFVADPDRGGLFKLVDIGTTNRGTALASSDSATKMWQRIFDGKVEAKWFGVSADGVTDDTVALQNARDVAGALSLPLLLPAGSIRVVPSSGKTNYKDAASDIIQRMVPSGMVLPGFLYEVAGSAGTVNYRGTNYSIGSQITGNFYYRGYARQTQIETATLNGAGSGYVATDVLTLALSGGSGTAATITVDTVDGGGAITGFTLTTAGDYTTPSTTETAVATTGGSGTGATFDITQEHHATKDAALIPVFDVALWATNNVVSIHGAGRGLSQIFVDGDGVGLGILGTTPGTDPGGPHKITIQDVDFVGNGSSASVGLFASHAVFHGRFSLYAENIQIGAIFNQCWNMHLENASANGLAEMDDFLQFWNLNQTTIDHMFTLNFRKGAIVDTGTAHGQVSGAEFVMNDDDSKQQRGFITEVLDADTFLAQEIDDESPVTIGTQEIVFDPDGSPTTNTLSYVKIFGGRGLVMSNVDGLNVDGTWQNDTESAIHILADRGQGNFGPAIITGHVEGPANGLVVERAPFDPNAFVRNLDVQLRVFAGRPASGSFIGDRNGIRLAHVKNARIHNTFITAKSENVSTNYGVWIQDTCTDVKLDNLTFDTDVAANKIQDDQAGLVKGPSQVVMYDILAPTLDTKTGISANSAQVTATVNLQGRVAVEYDNDSFSQWPQYVIVRTRMTPTAVGASGRIRCRLTNIEVNSNTHTDTVNVNFNAAEANENYDSIDIFPVSDSGQIRFQWFVTSGVGWTVDCEMRQLGAIY